MEVYSSYDSVLELLSTSTTSSRPLVLPHHPAQVLYDSRCHIHFNMRSCARAYDPPLGCLHAAENTIPKQWNDSCIPYRLLIARLGCKGMSRKATCISSARSGCEPSPFSPRNHDKLSRVQPSSCRSSSPARGHTCRMALARTGTEAEGRHHAKISYVSDPSWETCLAYHFIS
ncbi:hypothetical protein F5883DRAFT_229449 [Diaporthe sp. PMI_573]|nr:hypothetical protein F5883DRAFT_229449 [Diaporthaceae sp. PMI_573]